MSTPFFSTSDRDQPVAVILRGTVGRRPDVRTPNFGKWLETCRGTRSLEAIGRQLRPLVAATGLKVSRSLILKLEQGQVPNWPLLAALAKIYKTPWQSVVSRLAQDVEFSGARDLLRPSAERTSGDGSQQSEGHDESAISDPARVFAALTEAASVFHDLCERCSQQRDRLEALAVEHGIAVVARQTASPRAHQPAGAADRRASDRRGTPPDVTRRRKRGA